jgi:exonuclease VII large subunit
MDLPCNLTLAAVSSLLALAGCASTPTGARSPARLELASSAQVLDQNSRVLAQRSDDQSQTFAADAHALAQYAYDLREAAESGRASDSELQADFDRVTRSYQAVKNDANRLATPEAQADLELVNDAYHSVASQMAGTSSGANLSGS